MNPGYVYALINPAYSNLIKVGKTIRSPEEKAAELSSGPGVPTPFVVAYHIQVNDCDSAERHIHNVLEDAGHRVSESRKFFSAPLKVVIDELIEAESLFPSEEGEVKGLKL